MNTNFKEELIEIGFEGEIATDLDIRTIYSTDASAYRELPMAVVFPKNTFDIQKLIKFSAKKL